MALASIVGIENPAEICGVVASKIFGQDAPGDLKYLLVFTGGYQDFGDGTHSFLNRRAEGFIGVRPNWNPTYLKTAEFYSKDLVAPAQDITYLPGIREYDLV